MGTEPERRSDNVELREAMQRGMGGGWPGYLQRLREGHRPTFGKGKQVVYTGCSCGVVLCVVPHLLAHVDDLIAAYEAKVQDFAAETLRGSAARAAIQRTISPILLAQRLNEPPLYSGEFFDGGFPPDEREQVQMALTEDEWEAVTSMVLEPGHTGVLRAADGRRPNDE